MSSLLVNKGFSIKEAEQFLELLSNSTSKEAQIAASLYFRKKLSNCQQPPGEVMKKLVVELLSCLSRPSHEIQLNAAWALTNLACGTRDDTHLIVNNGGVAALYRKANESTGEVRDQAIWALGNVAADCRNCREQVRQSRLLPLLISLLRQPDYQAVDARKTVIWCIVNILRGGMSDIALTKCESLFEQLYRTMSAANTPEEVLSDAMWSTAYLLDHGGDNTERIDIALDNPYLLPMVIEQLASAPSNRVLTGALRIVGNIVTGTDDQATLILNHGLLDKLVPLIEHGEEQTVRETLWILSNIAAGTEEHIARLLQVPGLAERLFELCHDPSVRKRKEAYWTIVNCVMSADQQVYFHLLSGGVAHVFEQVLDENPDQSLTERTLLTIQHSLRDRPERINHTRVVFKCVGLVTKLHQCVLAAREAQMNPPFNWQFASAILREHFDVDATQPIPPAPQTMTLSLHIKPRKHE